MGLSVTSGEISDLDAKIQNLVADVNKATAMLPILSLQCTDLMRRWVVWRDTHTTFLAQSGIPNFESGLDASRVNAEFLAFVSEYNEKRRQFIASGGETTAKEADPNAGPLDKVADSAGKILVFGILGFIVYKVATSSKGDK